MEHPPIAYINPTVAHARGIIGSLEKHKVAGPWGACGGADVVKPLRPKAAHIPAGMIDHP